MTDARLWQFVVAALVAGALVAPAASAGKPSLERIAVDDTFADEFLTDECGVDVTTRATGHVTIRTFADGGTGPAELVTLNVALTATAGDNVYRFRDVGADMTRIEPDGTAILLVIGQVPFDFTGVLKIDLETGEAIHLPHHGTSGELAAACAALTS